MARTDLYVKIQLDHGDDEKPDRLAEEICRQIGKTYGVRSAEIQNLIPQTE